MGKKKAYVADLVDQLACRGEIESELVRRLAAQGHQKLRFKFNDAIPAILNLIAGCKRMVVGTFVGPPAFGANQSQWTAWR